MIISSTVAYSMPNFSTKKNGKGKKQTIGFTQSAVASNPFAILAKNPNNIANISKISFGLTSSNGKELPEVIGLKSEKMQKLYKTAYKYMSKPNQVQAYRFNPNGTPEVVLANNPHVYQKDGEYYVPNKWSETEPYKIDTSKEQMIMIYDKDDFAVCDGKVFEGSYVSTESYEAGKLEYQKPSDLPYGKIINFTKQAPGAFTVLPEGQKVETLEGVRTIGKGEVLCFDHEGNPYVQPAKRVLSRNIVNSELGIYKLEQLVKQA